MSLPDCSRNHELQALSQTVLLRIGKFNSMRHSFHYFHTLITISSVQFISVAQSCPTLCGPMDCSRPGLPVHHQLSEFTQTHVRWISDAIHPSHPLSVSSPPAFNLSQHQGLFKWVNMSCELPSNLTLCFHSGGKRPVILLLQAVNTLVCLCSLTYLFIWLHWILVMDGRSLLHHLSSIVTSPSLFAPQHLAS